MADDERLSDEATGLPPLEEIEDDRTVLLLGWYATEGLVASPWTGEPQPVRYLHVRGLAQGAGGATDIPEWVQTFIAVPVEHVLDVASDLAKGSTDSFGDEDSDDAPDEITNLRLAVARIKTYCQDALEVFAREGIDSTPAIGVADVLKMLGDA